MRLTIIGRLLPMQAIAAMRGASTSAFATRTATIRPIAIMCGALEQDSEGLVNNEK